MNTFADRCVSRSPEETHALARAVVARLPVRAVVALHGDLGAGKTCFVQGMAAALRIPESVISPTFTIIREYTNGLRPLFHMDFYRIGSAQDALALGIEEYFERDGIAAIEWAERAADVLPPHTVHVRFEPRAAEGERIVTCEWPACAAAQPPVTDHSR